MNSIVNKYLRRRAFVAPKQPGFDLKSYQGELLTLVSDLYTDIVNHKLNVMRVLETNKSLMGEAEAEKMSTFYKKFDKVTDEMESLLASIMGEPRKD